MPTACAQDVLEFQRLTHRTQFESQPPGTVELLPQVNDSLKARFAGQWDLPVESGRYRVDPTDSYCFAVHHRDDVQAGTSSRLAFGAFPVLQPQTQPVSPIPLFRNEGWSRGDDQACPGYDIPKQVPLMLERFVEAHGQDEVADDDRLQTHRWHGFYGDGVSWAERDVFWTSAASVDPRLTAGSARLHGIKDPDRDRIGLPAEPLRGLCQDLPLRPHPADVTPDPGHFPTLQRGQAVLVPARFQIGLLNPEQHQFRRAPQLLGDLGRSASTDLDHLRCPVPEVPGMELPILLLTPSIWGLSRPVLSNTLPRPTLFAHFSAVHQELSAPRTSSWIRARLGDSRGRPPNDWYGHLVRASLSSTA